MKDTFKHITANGKEYPFAFNINVIQAISEKYGNLEEWANSIITKEEGSIPDLGALKFLCKEAINEGIDMENDPECPWYVNRETPRPFINEKQAGRIISASENFNKFAMDTVKESNDTGKEKNLTTEQNQNGIQE